MGKKRPKRQAYFQLRSNENGDWNDDILKKPNKQMRSVWQIDTPKPSEKEFGKHPTQKPLELLRRIILASTNKGDLILNPFTGSSTTGIIKMVA